MRLFGRSSLSADVVARAGLPRGEKVLASAEARDGTWLLGTRRVLVLLPPVGDRAPVERDRVPEERREGRAARLEGRADRDRVPEERREERAARLEGPLLLPWEQVEDAAWDADGERLRITGVGEYGEPRPSYVVEMAEPALLLQLLRERVTASIVIQRRVPVRDGAGLVVIGRRSPAGGAIRWMHAYDPGLDPADPEVAAVAEVALTQARSEVGD